MSVDQNDYDVQSMVGDVLQGESAFAALRRVFSIPKREVPQNGQASLAVLSGILAEETFPVREQTPCPGPRRGLSGLSESETILYERGNKGEFPSGEWCIPRQREQRDCNGSAQAFIRSRSPRRQPRSLEKFSDTPIHQSFYNPSQNRRNFMPAVDRCNRCGEEQDCLNDCCVCRCGAVMLVSPRTNLVRWLPRSRARVARRVSWDPECISTAPFARSVSYDGANQGWYDTVEPNSSSNDVESDLRSDVPTNRRLDYESN